MRKCSLCGGRLDRDKRCTFCGLDNTRNDEMYRHLVNQSACSDKPLTHVHEEPTQTIKQEIKLPNKIRTTKKDKNGGKAIIAVLIAVFSIGGALVELVDDMSSNFYSSGYEYIEDYDPYEYVIEDMPEDGASYSTTLSGGQYLVGVDIPVGIYTVTAQGTRYGDISIEDAKNGIYYYEWLDEDGSIEDIRLYEGASFSVSAGFTVYMETENAQECNTLSVGNFEAEEVQLQDGMVAGVDFPIGVYDIVYIPSGDEYDYGSVYWTVITEEGYEVQRDIFVDAEGETVTYQNVALPKDTVINLEDIAEEKVRLVPTEKVYQTDLNEIYRAY